MAMPFSHFAFRGSLLADSVSIIANGRRGLRHEVSPTTPPRLTPGPSVTPPQRSTGHVRCRRSGPSALAVQKRDAQGNWSVIATEGSALRQVSGAFCGNDGPVATE